MTTATKCQTAPERPDPLEEAREWLRRSTGAGATASVIRRMIVYAERLLRELQKAKARVVELEESMGSSAEMEAERERDEHGT